MGWWLRWTDSGHSIPDVKRKWSKLITRNYAKIRNPSNLCDFLDSLQIKPFLLSTSLNSHSISESSDKLIYELTQCWSPSTSITWMEKGFYNMKRKVRREWVSHCQERIMPIHIATSAYTRMWLREIAEEGPSYQCISTFWQDVAIHWRFHPS